MTRYEKYEYECIDCGFKMKWGAPHKCKDGKEISWEVAPIITDPQRTLTMNRLEIWKEKGGYVIRKISTMLGVIKVNEAQLSTLFKKIGKILMRKQRGKDIEPYCPCCRETLPPTHDLIK